MPALKANLYLDSAWFGHVYNWLLIELTLMNKLEGLRMFKQESWLAEKTRPSKLRLCIYPATSKNKEAHLGGEYGVLRLLYRLLHTIKGDWLYGELVEKYTRVVTNVPRDISTIVKLTHHFVHYIWWCLTVLQYMYMTNM